MLNPIATANRNPTKNAPLDEASEGWVETEPDGAGSLLDAPTHCFVARQPIFDMMGETYGFELLFRVGSDNYFTGDSDTATRIMVDNWLLHGLDKLTGGGFQTFLNCTREALVGGLVTLLPSRRTVLELLETIEPDDEVLTACQRLKRLGFGIALDDFKFSKKMERFVELADYVKVDFRLPDAEHRRTVRCLQGSGVKMVAEKIETEEELKIAFGEGFELFQGYFFGRPTLFSKRKNL